MIISIAPFSEYERQKEWGVSNYLNLMDRLSSHDINLLGSENEDYALVTDTKFNDYRGKLTIAQSSRIIYSSDLFIGNDGGLYHIASMLGVETIVIFMMPDHMARVAYFNKPNVRVMYKPTVEEVLLCL